MLLLGLLLGCPGEPDLANPPRVLDLLDELAARSDSTGANPSETGIVAKWALKRGSAADVVIEGSGRREERHLLLESTAAEMVAVRLPHRFEASTVNGLVLHLKIRGDEARPFGRLFWRRDGEEFAESRFLRFDLDVDDVNHFTSLAIPITHPEWTGEIVELRLEPLVGTGVVRLGHVILGRAEVATPRSLSAARRGRLTLGEDSRRARRCPVPGRLETEVDIPGPAMIRLALGASLPESSPGLRLSIQVDGETLHQADFAGADGSRWQLVRLPLDRWAGQRVRLTLAAEGLTEGSAGSAWFSAPKIVPQGEPDRPNVVMISLDTLRADHLSLYGYERPTSPALDALGDQSWVFERAYAQAPVTLPSHVSLFTGRYRDEGLEWGHRRLPPKTLTLAELLRRAGYLTAAFTGGGYLAEDFGVAEGFDLFNDEAGGAERVFSRGLAWLDSIESTPFFLFLHTYEIHSPYNPPEPYRSRFARDPGSLPERLTGEDLYQMALASPPPSPEEWQAAVDLYDAGIAYTDDCLARLLASLERRGLTGDTLVVILSDHGEELGDRGGTGHGHSLFEEMIRVPLIVTVPERWRERLQLDRPTRVRPVVELVDVLPTVADLIGISTPPVDGDSLIDLLRRRSFETGPAFTGFQPSGHEGRALITERWKLYRFQARDDVRSKIRVSPDGDFVFDLENDPAERRDLSGVHEELRASLLEELRRAEAGWLRHALGETAEPMPALTPERIEELRRLGYLQGR